jgi:RHS repeat-associated protein
LDKQPYKFGGKEYETMHGLNLYDFEARPYDPIQGRFLTPDPLAEKYPWINCIVTPDMIRRCLNKSCHLSLVYSSLFSTKKVI